VYPGARNADQLDNYIDNVSHDYFHEKLNLAEGESGWAGFKGVKEGAYYVDIDRQILLPPDTIANAKVFGPEVIAAAMTHELYEKARLYQALREARQAGRPGIPEADWGSLVRKGRGTPHSLAEEYTAGRYNRLLEKLAPEEQ
jgi:hypothetical protein